MKKILACLVVTLLYSSFSAPEYLNPIYPVYAEETEKVTTPIKKPLVNKLEEEKKRIASKEAEMKKKLGERKDAIASKTGELREKMASKGAVLKERLSLFKDKAKASRVEKINANLTLIAEKRTQMMKNHLTVLTKILETIETKITEAQTSGTNVDTAKSAISEARSAIQTASTAVNSQLEKDYTIEATSEATVKIDAKRTRDSLFKDLKSNHELVRQAREAVQKALKAAKEALVVTATPSAQ